MVYAVTRLPIQAEEGGATPTLRLQFETCQLSEANQLLTQHHYLGAAKASRQCFAAWKCDELVACMVWRWPTARMLPSDGSWLELSRWCLTPMSGANSGSQMMSWVVRWIRRNMPEVTTLVSYSDPVHGHTGSLYKASNWQYEPTHIGRRYDLDGIGFPSGNGSWNGVDKATPKHRWIYRIGRQL